jgi:type VI protein secretion system component VasK
LLAGLWMRRWIFLVLGVLLAIVGVLWIGQGFNMLGQSGGMNGQHVWAFIGLVCAVAGLGLIAAGVRAGRAARLPRAR